jgi:hypothetical protein
MGKMRAFSINPTISTKIWDVLEYIGIDWKQFTIKSDRGHTGFYLVADRQVIYAKLKAR